MAGNPNTLRILTQAILEKRCVAIRCEGRARLVTIEPHAIYTDEQNNIVIDCFQKSGASEEDGPEGFWNTVGWRKINAVFWLNTFFAPRLNQGFVETDERYQNGLVAIIQTGSRLKQNKQMLHNIESSIEQLVAANHETRLKH